MTVIKRKRLTIAKPPPRSNNTQANDTNSTNGVETVTSNNPQATTVDVSVGSARAMVTDEAMPNTSNIEQASTSSVVANTPTVASWLRRSCGGTVPSSRRRRNRNRLSSRIGIGGTCREESTRPYNAWQADFQCRFASFLFISKYAKKIREEDSNGIAMYSLPLAIGLKELKKYLSKSGFSATGIIFQLIVSVLITKFGSTSQTMIYCAVNQRAKKVTSLCFARPVRVIKKSRKPEVPK